MAGVLGLKQLTNPPYEPCTRAQAKNWLKIDDDITVDDTEVDRLIKAVRELAENLTFRTFVPRTFKLTLPDWPYDSDYGWKINLPMPPLITVDSIVYVDLNGAQQTLSTALYAVHSGYTPGFIVPAWGAALPFVRRVPNALEVSFTAGYTPGSPADETGYQEVLPEALRLWMKTKMGTLYNIREQLIVGTSISEVPRNFTDGLLDPLVVGDRLF